MKISRKSNGHGVNQLASRYAIGESSNAIFHCGFAVADETRLGPGVDLDNTRYDTGTLLIVSFYN